jgi:hypothetical protein
MEQDNPNSPLEPNFTAIANAITSQTQVLQQFLSTMPTTITAIPPPIPPKYHIKYYPSTALGFKISTIWILEPRKDKHTVDKQANSHFIQCGAYHIFQAYIHLLQAVARNFGILDPRQNIMIPPDVFYLQMSALINFISVYESVYLAQVTPCEGTFIINNDCGSKKHRDDD